MRWPVTPTSGPGLPRLPGRACGRLPRTHRTTVWPRDTFPTVSDTSASAVKALERKTFAGARLSRAKIDCSSQHSFRVIVLSGEIQRIPRRDHRTHPRFVRHRGGILIHPRLGQQVFGWLVQTEPRVGLAHGGQQFRANPRLASQTVAALVVADFSGALVEHLLDGNGIAAVLAGVRQLKQRHHELRRAIWRSLLPSAPRRAA